MGREARPVAPGLPHEFRIDATSGSTLEIGFGIPRQRKRQNWIMMKPQRRGATPGSQADQKRTATLELVVTGAGLDVRRRIEVSADGSAEDTWTDVALPIDRSGTLRVSVTPLPPARPQAVVSLPILRTATPGRARGLLVVLDTLRADRLSAMGYAEPLTPHLDRLSRQATIHARCLSTSNWTLPAHADLFTGQRGFEHGIRRFELGRELPLEEVPAWVARLRDLGFETLAQTENVYVSPDTGLERGFDRFRTAPYDMRFGLAELVEWLEPRRDDDWFAFLHTYDAHAPYAKENDLPWLSRGLGGASGPAATGQAGQREKARAHRLLYDDGVVGLDRTFGHLMAQLRRMGVWPDMSLVVTSDHGDHLGEDGRFGHGNSFEDELLHVPLIVKRRRGEGAIDPRLIELREVGALLQADLEGRLHRLPESPLSVATDANFVGRLRLTSPTSRLALPTERLGGPLEGPALAHRVYTHEGLNLFLARAAGTTLKLSCPEGFRSGSIYPESAGRVEIRSGEALLSIYEPLASVFLEPSPAERLRVEARGYPAELRMLLGSPPRPGPQAGAVDLEVSELEWSPGRVEPPAGHDPVIWLLNLTGHPGDHHAGGRSGDQRAAGSTGLPGVRRPGGADVRGPRGHSGCPGPSFGPARSTETPVLALRSAPWCSGGTGPSSTMIPPAARRLGLFEAALRTHIAPRLNRDSRRSVTVREKPPCEGAS